MATAAPIRVDHGRLDAGQPLLGRLDQISTLPDQPLSAAARSVSAELIRTGETVLESWIRSKGQEPTNRQVEGFRLLALHRQGAKGDPSFNACRESCRELLYLVNCADAEDEPSAKARHLRLAAMVARHLVLFIDGKLENAGLGEFCCSSRPLRQQDAQKDAPAAN